MLRIVNFMETLNLHKLQINKIVNENKWKPGSTNLSSFKTNEQAYYRKNHP